MGLLDFQSNYCSPPPASSKTGHRRVDLYSSLIAGLPASTLVPPLYPRRSSQNTKSLFLGSCSGLSVIINTYTPTHDMCAPLPCSLTPAPRLHKWPTLHTDLWEELSFVPPTAFPGHRVSNCIPATPWRSFLLVTPSSPDAVCPPRWGGDPSEEEPALRSLHLPGLAFKDHPKRLTPSAVVPGWGLLSFQFHALVGQEFSNSAGHQDHWETYLKFTCPDPTPL